MSKDLENNSVTPNAASNGSAAHTRGPLSTGAGRTARDYINIICDWWYVGVIVGAAATAFFAISRYNQPEEYGSRALVRFDFDKDRVAPVADIEGPAHTDIKLKNHFQDLRNNFAFREQVAQSFTQEEAAKLVEPYRDPDSGEAPSVQAVIAMSNRTRPQDGHIFLIEFHHREAEQAQLLTSRFVEEYNQFLIDRNRQSYDSALRFQRQKVEELRRRVEMGELEAQDYRRERNLVSLDERKDLITENLKNIHASLNSARIAKINIDARVGEVDKAIGEGRELTEIPVILNNADVQTWTANLRDLKAQRALMALRYGEKHPRMINNQASIEQAQVQLDTAVRKAVAELRENQESQQVIVDSFTEELKRAEGDSMELDRVRIEYEVLLRKIANDQSLYQRMLSLYNDTQIASQLIESGMSVISPAAPMGRVAPSGGRIFLYGGFIFALCFAGAPILIELIANRLKSRSDVEGFLGQEYLGEIHKVKGKRTEKGRIVLDKHPREFYEMFRALYSHITLLLDKKLPKTFVVTSAIPAEGKSFVAANLAASFSRHHYRVLLLDGDLRHPSQQRVLGVDGSAGLLTFLAKRLEPASNTHREMGIISVAENFDLLPTGGRTEEATEVVRSHEFANLMRYLRSVYDVIIIDSPPAGVFPDAVTLGEFADHFLFVAKANKHGRNKIKSLLTRIDRGGNKVLGVVFNMLSASRSQRYGSFNYEYDYYGRYYGKEEAKAAKDDAAQAAALAATVAEGEADDGRSTKPGDRA